MDLKVGFYYRHIENGVVVKVLHAAVYSMSVPSCPPVVVYRLNDDEYPHRFEYVFQDTFKKQFEGPLDWDVALKAFK
jgi:hypothetical protein